MAIPLEYVSTTEDAAEKRTTEWALLILGCCGTILGTVLLFIKVESVLWSGSALLLIGAFLTRTGWKARRRWTIVAGAAHCAICLLFVSLVQMLRWGPLDAKIPFRILSVIYVAVAGWLAETSWWARRSGR